MTTETIKHTYQLKRGPSENWEQKNPVLLEGEPGFETDTYGLKIGDGFTAYNALPYVGSGKVVPGNSTQANWQQNDSTQPDYVKNRTHYITDAIHPDIEWDGVINIQPYFTLYQETDGEEIYSEHYVQLTNQIFPLNMLWGTEITNINNFEDAAVNTIIITEHSEIIQGSGFIVIDNTMLIITDINLFKNAMIQDGFVMPNNISEGIYSICITINDTPQIYIKSILFPVDIQQIDAQYLPNSNIADSVCKYSLAQATSQAGIKGFKIQSVAVWREIMDHPGATGPVPDLIHGAWIKVNAEAIQAYEVGDVINYDAAKHWYNRLYIKEIDIDNNAMLIDTLDKNILQIDETNMALGPDPTDNWVWVADKNVGEPIDQYVGAFAAGYNSQAIGYGAFAAGRETQAIGNYATALGRQTKANYASMAVGLKTHALGQQSFAGGSNAQAFGSTSLSFGSSTVAKGACATALGSGSQANGTHSVAAGNQTIAGYANQFVTGKFNKNNQNTMFEVGIGYDNSSRKNAFEVYSDGTATLPEATLDEISKRGENAIITLKALNSFSDSMENQVNTQLKAANTELTNVINYKTNRKSAKGEIIELYDIDNKDTVKLTSTVQDNYLYKENFLTDNSATGIIAAGVAPAIFLHDNTKCQLVRHNFTALVNYTTAYLVFKTPTNQKITSFDVMTDAGSINITTTKPLKPSNQYMVILKLKPISASSGAPDNYYQATPAYLVDYQNSYHWIKDSNVTDIPLPNCIMIPHVGRIDKNDTLTAEWTASEQYKIPLQKLTRADVSDPYDYQYIDESVPYVYGVYNKPNSDGTFTETQGLIKTSIGGIKTAIREQIQIDVNKGTITSDKATEYTTNLDTGLIPEKYRHMIDAHTFPIRDGNGAMPVGLRQWKEDANGNIIEGSDELWYGGAAPAAWVQQSLFYGKLLPISRGLDNPNHDGVRGWETGIHQNLEEKYKKSGILIREKNPRAADVIDQFNAEILAKTELTKLNADDAQQIGARGLYTASFGGCSSAQGKRAFAEGTNTVAIGKYSHAEGDNSVTLGNDSHAEGYATTTYGQGSHAEGGETVALGSYSHAGGTQSVAAGDASFAHGSGAIAVGTHSVAFGNQTRAEIDNQFVIGKFNNNKTDTFFEVGCGVDSDTLENAFEVGKNFKTQEHFIRIGNIELTDTQLKKLLDLIQE